MTINGCKVFMQSPDHDKAVIAAGNLKVALRSVSKAVASRDIHGGYDIYNIPTPYPIQDKRGRQND